MNTQLRLIANHNEMHHRSEAEPPDRQSLDEIVCCMESRAVDLLAASQEARLDGDPDACAVLLDAAERHMIAAVVLYRSRP